MRLVVGLAGAAISLTCVWLAFRLVPLPELAQALLSANYWWLLPAMIAQLLATLARTRRWQLLLLGKVGLADAFWALMIGLLGNNLLPLRAGEAARAVVLNQRTGVPLAQIAGSVVLERSLDVLVILGLLVVLLPLMQVPAVAIAAAAALGAALTAVAVLLVSVVWFPNVSDRLLGVLTARLPARLGGQVIERWHQLLAGFATLRDPRLALPVAGWSILSWAGTVGLCWSVLEAVVPGSSLLEASFTTVAISLGISVPSSPGYLGVFQYVAQQALVVPFPDRYSPSAALTGALLIHAIYYVFSTGLGAVGLMRLGLSLGAVRRAAQAPIVPSAGSS